MKTIIDLLSSDKKVSVVVLMLAVLTAASTYLAWDTNAKVNETLKINQGEVVNATTLHSFNLLKFNLRDVDDMQSVKKEIQMWYELKWGAQIAALQTVCGVAQSKLNVLMTEEVKIFACKLVS